MKFIHQSLEELYLKKQFDLIYPLSHFLYFFKYFKHQFMYSIKAHQKQKSQNQNFNGIFSSLILFKIYEPYYPQIFINFATNFTAHPVFILSFPIIFFPFSDIN